MNLEKEKNNMGHRCNVCGYTHSCRCGGKRCKCGMSKGQSTVTNNIIARYSIEDTTKLVELIKTRMSTNQILDELDVESTETVAQQYQGTQVVLDKKFARSLGMKNVYCEYDSFSSDTKCKFCGRHRNDGYLKPCLYYMAKKEGQTE